MNELLQAALWYASRGWKVMPLHWPVNGGCSCLEGIKCKTPGKHPRVKWGTDASSDPAVIEGWWRKWPQANVGIATGSASGLIVLDPDGTKGFQELAELARKHGILPDTMRVETGNGMHVYFAGSGLKNLGRKKKLDNNLHLRGENGLVVAPPSLHVSGRRYRWVNPQAMLYPLPTWIPEWRRSIGDVNPDRLVLQGMPAYAGRAGKLAARGINAINAWSPHDEARLRAALMSIPVTDSDYDDFLNFGMGLKALEWFRSDGTSIGFDIWRTWAAQSRENFDEQGLISKWNSFKKEGVTVGTLFHRAREEGWKGEITPEIADEVKPETVAQTAPNDKPLNGHIDPFPQVTALPPNTAIFLETDKNGRARPTCANTRLAIRDLGLVCEHDLFHDKLRIGGQALAEWAGDLSDNAVHMLRVVVHQRYKFDPGTVHAYDAAVQECLQNGFDPVQDYLDDLRWDGTPRLDQWMPRYLGAELTLFNCAISRLSLMAAVRRARQPGCKFDQVMVLEGPEGRGKSSAIEILAGTENFSDQTILGLDDRAQQEAVQGTWLYEIADLARHSKSEVEGTKAFIARTRDRARPAYGRSRVDRPRRCVFFATTNDSTYLKSQTGNRRFWPVQCGRIDLDTLARDRDQLWAEAAAREQGASIVLPEKLWTEASTLQDSRRDHDPWDDILGGNIGRPTKDGREYRISSVEVMAGLLQMPTEKQNDVTAKRVAFTMRRLGWDGPKLIRLSEDVTDGATQVCRGYTRPAKTAS